ncbi:MAG: hypothetical protein ACC700_18865 [Anaerolineales bacterium]
MPTCNRCGGEIIFKHVDGVCTPMHLGGGWCSADSSEENQRVTFKYSLDSYVNPHAECPVCGAPVFFYQSPYGGRVFFDELGPPWPKHPCTDNTVTTDNPIRETSTGNTKRYSWEESGWQPFIVIEIRELDSAPVIKYEGTYKGELLWLYGPNGDLLPDNSPIHIRPKGDSCYEMSTILGSRSGMHDFHVKAYIAYGSLLDAAKTQRDKSSSNKMDNVNKTQSKPKHRSHKQTTKSKTAMEIALGRARKNR